MTLRTRCPRCAVESVLPDEMRGKSVRCKKCSHAFTVKPIGAEKVGSDSHAAIRPGAPVKSRPQTTAENADEPRHAREGPSTTLWFGLAGIGAATLVASVIVFVLITNRHPQVAHAQHPPAPPAVPQAPVAVLAEAPKPADPAPVPKGKPEPVKLVNAPPVDPTPVARPVVAVPPVIAAPNEPEPIRTPDIGKLYGTQGGEKIAPALAGKTALPRASANDSFYRITNMQVQSPPGRERGNLAIEFRIEQVGKLSATHFFLRFPTGKVELVPAASAIADSLPRGGGVFTAFRDPNSPAGGYPDDVQCFLVRVEMAYGAPEAFFQVSNAFVLGNKMTPMLARDWTEAEIARFSKEPQAGLKENAFPNVGRNTLFAGNALGHQPRRHVDPEKPLLGLEYKLGQWAGEACLQTVRPIYSTNQNPSYPKMVVARPGYAVAGAEVQVLKYVDAIKLHFRRIRPDGSLDPADAYQSDWIGEPTAGARTFVLGNTGTRVLGVYLRGGAVLDGIALVLDAKEP